MRSTRSTHWVVYLRFEEMTVIMLAFSPRRISRLFRRVIQVETEKVSACTFPLPFPSYIYMCFMAFASGHDLVALVDLPPDWDYNKTANSLGEPTQQI